MSILLFREVNRVADFLALLRWVIIDLDAGFQPGHVDPPGSVCHIFMENTVRIALPRGCLLSSHVNSSF